MMNISAVQRPGVQFGAKQKPVVLDSVGDGHFSLSAELRKTLEPSRNPQDRGSVWKLDEQQFKAMQNSFYSYPKSLKEMQIDFSKQTPILIHPDVYTSTGMARLVAGDLRYDQQKGLTIDVSVKYPSGGSTCDIGDPWLLVVVDKKFTDKDVNINMVQSGWAN